MWSDECQVKCVTQRRAFVRRPHKISRYHPKFTIKTVKYPGSVMIWGAFSGAAGKGGLKILENGVTMNAKRYIGVLKAELLPYFHLHGSQKFMHDGAPCHRAKVVTRFLGNKGIPTIKWPGNSPDLNPIENVWAYMKDKIADKRNMSVTSITKAIKEFWAKDMDMTYLLKLADSMPRRIRKVIRANGHGINY